MSRLAALQRAFQRHVDRPGRALEREVAASPRASAQRRLGVYADGHRSRLVEALGSDYPALRGLLGAAGFERLVRRFIDARPSRQPNLRWYGGELAPFLARSPRWRGRPLLAELARFEWALGLAFDAADAPLASVEEVARLPAEAWPAMRLRLHPSVQLLRLRSNAPHAWRAVTTGRRPPSARPRLRPACWLVWRKGFEPFFRELPAAEAWALAAVGRGRDFAALTDGLRRYAGAGRAAEAGAQLLRDWLVEGLICRIRAETGAALP